MILISQFFAVGSPGSSIRNDARKFNQYNPKLKDRLMNQRPTKSTNMEDR